MSPLTLHGEVFPVPSRGNSEELFDRDLDAVTEEYGYGQLWIRREHLGPFVLMRRRPA